MKHLYVSVVHAVRRALAAVGLLRILDRRAETSRTALWVRSWLAIYDLDDLAALGVPWWTFDAIDEVERFLAAHPRARTFEWGSGVSTLWLAAHGAQVTSVEHDRAWAERMLPLLPASVTLHVVEPAPAGPGAVRSGKAGFAGLDFASYVAAVDAVPGDLDLVVIDGRAREACLDRVLDRLAPGGLIVFDDTERDRYAAAIRRHGAALDVRWTRGRTPTIPYPCDTALVRLARVAAP
jgi:hypothetical protein